MNGKKCCLCGREYVGYGNNAQPLADGRCCDACNQRVVSERFRLLMVQMLDDLEGVA